MDRMYSDSKPADTATHTQVNSFGKKNASSTESERALPVAIKCLQAAIENIEGNQSALHGRLELLLDPTRNDDDGKDACRPPATTVANILDCFTRRLHAIGAQQRDILDRLHV